MFAPDEEGEDEDEEEEECRAYTLYEMDKFIGNISVHIIVSLVVLVVLVPMVCVCVSST